MQPPKKKGRVTRPYGLGEFSRNVGRLRAEGPGSASVAKSGLLDEYQRRVSTGYITVLEG